MYMEHCRACCLDSRRGGASRLMVAGFAWLLGSIALAEDATTQPAEEPRVNFLGLDADPIDEPMVTDRPDFTESTLTVPRGRAQIELGYTYVYDEEDGVRAGDHVFPESLLRVGLAKAWELRVAWLGGSLTESMFRETNDAGRRVDVKDHDDGATDMSIGFKHHIREQDGWIPDMGVIGEVSIPTGTRSKTSGDVDPGAKFLWSYALTDRLSLSGNFNIAVRRARRAGPFRRRRRSRWGMRGRIGWARMSSISAFIPTIETATALIPSTGDLHFRLRTICNLTCASVSV